MCRWELMGTEAPQPVRAPAAAEVTRGWPAVRAFLRRAAGSHGALESGDKLGMLALHFTR